jgi:hypothetical protein
MKGETASFDKKVLQVRAAAFVGERSAVPRDRQDVVPFADQPLGCPDDCGRSTPNALRTTDIMVALTRLRRPGVVWRVGRRDCRSVSFD